MKFIKQLLFMLVFFALINGVYSLEAHVYVNETSSLTKLLNGEYSLVADGIIEIHNPSDVSTIYEFNIPLELDALIGISKVDVDSSSSRFDFTYDRINGFIINPNETIKVGYHIFGLLNYNIYNLIGKNRTVLDYYSPSFDLSSKIILNLQKPQREGYMYNNDSTLNATPFGNSTRLISAGIRNPTDYDYIIKELKLYRTNVGDPFFMNGQLIKVFKNLSIAPFQFKGVDFVDPKSNDQSVYWLSSNVIIKTLYNFTSKTHYLVQKQTGGSGGGGGGSSGGANFGGSNSIVQQKTENLLNSILLKKGVDKTVVRRGDSFNVILRVVNVNDFEIDNLTLHDEIPQGYEIKNVSQSMILNERKLIFNVNSLKRFGTKIITYTLVNKNDLKGITYLKPASLTYDNETIYSEGVLVINDLLPNKKIFVQKEVKYLDNNYVKVTIKVKNLGQVTVNNLLVSDFVDNNSLIKDISQVFYKKNVWKIKSLKAGGEWEVTYITQRNDNLDKLPNVFGIDKSNIYGTLISSEQVVTIFHDEPKTIEKVGMGLAVGLLVFYLLF